MKLFLRQTPISLKTTKNFLWTESKIALDCTVGTAVKVTEMASTHCRRLRCYPPNYTFPSTLSTPAPARLVFHAPNLGSPVAPPGLVSLAFAHPSLSTFARAPQKLRVGVRIL